MKFAKMKITDNMICAVNPKEGACYGDSGGPLITLGKNGTYQQIGITSWNDLKIDINFKDPAKSKVTEQCLLKSPSVFSRVTAQLDWIKKMIKRK